MAKPKVGCHLIVFRGKDREDLDAVLRDVQAAGYDGIEGRIFFDGDAPRTRATLEQFGLVQWSLSAGFGALHEIDGAIEYMCALEGKFIMVSGVGDHQTEGLRAYEQAAVLFNDVGRKCRDSGIQFCYHNHSWEFAEYDRASGREVPAGTTGAVTGLERLYELTDPQLVKGCVDVYWVQHGGRDPVEFLERYRDRVGYPHLKDMRYLGATPRRTGRLDRDEATFVELGRGEIDFPGIWRVLEPLDLPWVVYEQDRSELPAGEAAAISRRYLNQALGI